MESDRTPRTYQVIWEEKTLTYEWDGYLEQGEIHTITHQPGDEGRIMSINATLTLAMDILPTMLPQDNFSLTVDVREDAWSHTIRTEQDNITRNASASMEHQNLNPSSDAYNLTADSLEELLQMLDENRVQDLVRVIGYGLSMPKKRIQISLSMMSTLIKATIGNWLLSSHCLFQGLVKLEFEPSEVGVGPYRKNAKSRFTPANVGLPPIVIFPD